MWVAVDDTLSQAQFQRFKRRGRFHVGGVLIFVKDWFDVVVTFSDGACGRPESIVRDEHF